ncbi:hypothetical protein GCM10009670_16010 [Citricoccus alkalitolerans]
MVFLSYSWLWGGWFVRTMLGVTGLGSVDASRGPETAGHWLGLMLGTLVVMAPAILGFLAYMVAWIGWPGRPVPPRRNRWAGVGMGLAVAVTAFMLVGLAGYYWPVGRWRGGLHRYAAAVDAEVLGSTWVGDMYFGLLLALIGLYLVIFAAAILLPSNLGLVGWTDGQKPGRAGGSQPGGAGHPGHPDASGTEAEDSASSATLTGPEAYYAAKPSLWDTSRRGVSEAATDRAVGAGPTANPAPPETTEITGIWWPYAAGAAVVIASLVTAVWPHLSPGS